ncbi:MAG: methylenetetrahydrofolate--tRNA-(uracil(54)-C(5))-methyltransferase (FADH(2)-oxidizing) TrmFO [Oscillospiraceae bacterium]|nr:methylenetetrahydrofolate--tRNA-(uracil(54)-C(5))-methyltransferase (FADH(2)-oxidizing) TrmFO [Oscillospiraceae bacterium]
MTREADTSYISLVRAASPLVTSVGEAAPLVAVKEATAPLVTSVGEAAPLITSVGEAAPLITIVGAGLAGCEAAWQASRLGAKVRLIDMKPAELTPAHHHGGFAELVCSNSLGSLSVENAKGLLKQELRELGSLIVGCADMCKVPAGNALAVDRSMFSEAVGRALADNGNITIECARLDRIPDERPCIIATGPLTTQNLLDDIAARIGSGHLYFYDAASPIVTYASINAGSIYRSSRYDKGEGDYINCPMTREQYEAFTEALRGAQTADPHGFEDTKLFEACMPVESLARRGFDTLRFGPLKPKGLVDPSTGREPYAVVQLRQDDAEGRLYNLVGFQTRLKIGEQRRVFSMIPGLERAEFVRYGVMHRNAYIDSPGALDRTYAHLGAGSLGGSGLYFAGQITGVEGYIESVSSGFIAGISSMLSTRGQPPIAFPRETLIGALAAYISAERSGAARSGETAGNCEAARSGGAAGNGEAARNGETAGNSGGARRPAFQPMNANFGILPPLSDEQGARRSKRERNAAYAARSLAATKEVAKQLEALRAPTLGC